MYKVFISEVPVIICNSEEKILKEKGAKVVLYSFPFNWKDVLNNLHKQGVYVVGTDVEEIWHSFCSNFKQIAAAGGVVQNKKEEILCIFRNGKWDLPKGKVEVDEKIEVAAVREVEEECGVSDLIIIGALPNTYHTYKMNEIEVLKTTYWYAMKTDWENKLIPQLEEGISKVEWVKNNDLEKVKANTYQSILELLG